MTTKPMALVVAGMAVAILLSAPAFAAKMSLTDEQMDAVSGNANDYTFSGNSSSTVSLAGGASANIQFDWYQWTDVHAADASIKKGANDQSGFASQVQQNIGGKTNALIVGAAGQNVLNNTDGAVGGSQTNLSYAVFAGGGF